MSNHPGLAKGYALDFHSPVRYVADALGRASALSSEELIAGYRHHISGDITRVRLHEKLRSEDEANAFLIERALLALGKQVEQNGDGKWRLTRPFEELRYRRRKLRWIVNEHALLRDPFDRMSGRFSENIRRIGRDSMNELRESMREFGWVAEFPALIDERGVVLVGHRRLAVAAELGIEPVTKVLSLGVGDEADAKRFRLAIVSNIGFKDMTPEERRDIAEYLYGEREWTMKQIATALDVHVSTVGRDLGVSHRAKPKSRGGRPRKVTPEQEQKVLEVFFEEGKTRNEAADAGGVSHSTADVMIAREKGRRDIIEPVAVAELILEPAPETQEKPKPGPVDDSAAFEKEMQDVIAKWGIERARKRLCGEGQSTIVD